MSKPTGNLFPPGHFYSPIPSIDDLERDKARIFGPPPRELPGIDLHEPEQLALLQTFAEKFYPNMPFEETPSGGLRDGFVSLPPKSVLDSRS